MPPASSIEIPREEMRDEDVHSKSPLLLRCPVVHVLVRRRRLGSWAYLVPGSLFVPSEMEIGVTSLLLWLS